MAHQCLRLRVLPPKSQRVQTGEEWRPGEARGREGPVMARDAERATKGGPLMAALQDSGFKGPAAKRARSIGGGGGWSSAPATAPASESRAHPESPAAPTVEDADALDCGVCWLPLKPPIFQCDVGHMVCSPCRDKLQATGKCHVCGVAPSSYRRCHGMERLVESIRVQCSYAAYGCALRAAYYDQESHRSMCAHAPCHCPGEACSFVGSTTKLLDHFSTTHKWPCITRVKPNAKRVFTIHDGFNFLLADCSTGNKNKGDTASVRSLLMLTMERQQRSCFISVHWIDPYAVGTSGSQGPTIKEMQCELCYSLHSSYGNLCNSRLMEHYQVSKFSVARTNFSSGLPKPDEGFRVVVPNSAVGDGIDIQVKVKLNVSNAPSSAPEHDSAPEDVAQDISPDGPRRSVRQRRPSTRVQGPEWE